MYNLLLPQCFELIVELHYHLITAVEQADFLATVKVCDAL
jgi:hypothetical protein